MAERRPEGGAGTSRVPKFSCKAKEEELDVLGETGASHLAEAQRMGREVTSYVLTWPMNA